MSTLATINGKKLKAEISKDSTGFIVSVEIVVDSNTAILIRCLRKSETPVINGAKPTDIPAAGEKLALISEGSKSQSDAEAFAKKLLANIEKPENLPEYAGKTAHKDEKAKHKAAKESKVHFDKNNLKDNFKAHGVSSVPPATRKSPGGARGT